MLVVPEYENTYSGGRGWLLAGAFGRILEALLCDSGTCIKYLGLFGRREYYVPSLLKRENKEQKPKSKSKSSFVAQNLLVLILWWCS